MPSSEPKQVSRLAKHKAAAREYQAQQGLNWPTEPETNHTGDSEHQLWLMQQLQHTVASLQSKLDSLTRDQSSLQTHLDSVSRDNSILQATCDRQREQLDAYRKCDEAMHALVGMNPFVKPKRVSDLEKTIVDVFAPPTKKAKRKSTGDLYVTAKRSHTVPAQARVRVGDTVVGTMLARRRIYRLFTNPECTELAYEWTKEQVEGAMPSLRVQFEVKSINEGGVCVSVIAPQLHGMAPGHYFMENGSYIEVGEAQHGHVKQKVQAGEVQICVVKKERLQYAFNFSVERDGETQACHYPPCLEYVEPQKRIRFCIADGVSSSPGRMEFIGYYDEHGKFQPTLGNVCTYDMVRLEDVMEENHTVTRSGRTVGAVAQGL